MKHGMTTVRPSSPSAFIRYREKKNPYPEKDRGNSLL